MAGYKFGKTFDNDYFKKTFEEDYFKKGAYTPSEAVINAAHLLESHQKNNNPGAYKSQWDTQIKDLIGQIQGRDEFTYDLNGDALYQQYKDKYIKQGKMAMGDAIGQASAMTGGYGNSYAQSVGQQAYQAQLEHLNDIVPELYQMGLDKYIMEGQELYNQYGMLSNQDAADYGKHRDKVADYNAMLDYLSGRYDSERSFDYGKYADERDFAYNQYSSDRSLAYDKYSSDRTLDYNEYRNDIADDQWQQEHDLQVAKSGLVKNKDGTYSPKVVEPEDDDFDYSGWDALDWEGYFATILNTESQSAAEEELNRMTKAGLIPKKMLTYAAIGARGKLGH